MKNIFLVIVFTLVLWPVTAQSVSVEKSTFGIQTGLLGVWAHYESKISNQVALRTELGLDTGFFGSDVNDIDGLLLAPAITLEPRWYYNLERRKGKSKRIDGNSGNFISVKTTYHPDWFTISSEDNINLITDISIIPTWGIRRHLGNHFTYEAGFGIGYVRYFNEDNLLFIDENEVAVNLHLRIGYKF